MTAEVAVLRAGLLAVLCLSATCIIAAPAADERKAVLDTVGLLLDGWREANAAKLETALHKDFREVTMHLQEGAWATTVVDRSRLVGLMGKIDKGAWDDHLLAPQVLIDGPIAVVWSRYRFTVHFVEDGVAKSPAHCGIETFQLYRNDGAWKIVNFADTHMDSCPH